MCILIMPFTKSNACADPPTSACDLDIIVPDDITICSPEDFDIDADINGDYLEFFWTQDGEFLTDADLNPSVYIDETTSFTLTAFQMDEDNLIVNGDFESGDWIEYTDYYVGQGNCMSGLGFLACEGTYGILDDPSLGHTNFDPCSDHTGGGNMMVVNGASSFQQIWCQTIAVEPDGIYAFTAWAASVNPASPAQLQFAIDGQLIGNLFSLTGSTCQWEEFTAEWEASGQTSVEICITNQNTAASGNDFALDDISFHEICSNSNSFTVTYAGFEADWFTPEDISCISTESEIELFLDQTYDYDYSIEWDTDEGNIVTEQNDGAYILVDQAGTYSVTITNEYNCEIDLNIEVEADTLSPQMTIYKSNDLNCEDQLAILEADAFFGGIDISWYNASDSLLIEDEELVVNSSGWYIAEAFDDDNGCVSQDSVLVIQDTISPSISVLSSNPLNCHYDQTTLSISESYPTVLWIHDNDTIAINVDSINIDYDGAFMVIAEGINHCIDSTNIDIESELPVFEYEINYNPILDCNSPESELVISFDTSLYQVMFEQMNYDLDTSIIINESGVYYFEILDVNDCSEIDSVILNEDFIEPVFSLTGDTISCQEPSALLEVTTTGNDVYWTSPSGQNYSGDSLVTAIPGIYNVLITGSNGCTSSDSFELTSSELIPELSISGDTLNCNNEMVILLPESNQSDLVYSWILPDNSSSQNPSLTTSQAGIYNLVITNSTGCSASAEYLLVEDFTVPEIELTNQFKLDCNNMEITSDLLPLTVIGLHPVDGARNLFK